MRKSTIFISAVLTTFALVMLFRVASAYTNSKNAAPVAAVSTAITEPPTAEPVATDPPVPTSVALSPNDAAQLAAKVVGNTNLLSAESANYNGVNAYMVTFTNKDVVYVGMDGQILSVQIAPLQPVVVNAAAPTKKSHHSNNSSSSGGSQAGGGESEGHDD